MTRTVVVRLWVGLGVAAAVFVLAVVFTAARQQGDNTRRAIRACHARGPEYHYWQDRSRCVRYVGP